jgi:CRP-like cAMP-binding protein
VPVRFVRKLEKFGRLSKAERQVIVDASQNVRRVAARKPILHEEDGSQKSCVILAGLACRYKIVEDGGRQIVDFLVPGDFCEDDGHEEYRLGTLSLCTIAYLDNETLGEILERYPRISRSLWRASQADAAVLREWLVNIGRRAADKRVAYLICELCTRLQASDAMAAGGCTLPVSQIELADATALSTVHINRVLNRLRERRLLTLQRRSIIIKDLVRLKAYAQFQDGYLRLPKSA